MTWLSIKTFFAKLWAWCKKYWQILLGISIPIAIWIITRNKSPVREVVEKANKQHTEEVNTIERAHQVQTEMIEAAHQRHDAKVAQIIAAHESELIELDESKKKRIEQIVKNYESDPDEITKRISALTGIRHISN